jgi:uncharacterized membrane protein YccC
MFASLQTHLPSIMRRNTAGAGPHHNAVSPRVTATRHMENSRIRQQYEALAPGPQPVPQNLGELQSIVAGILHGANTSNCIHAQTKQILSGSLGQLEAECTRVVTLTNLAQRAASESAHVLLSRIRFFEALDDRINQISALRERFVDSRKTFREKPTKLLAGSIRDGKPPPTSPKAHALTIVQQPGATHTRACSQI